MPPRRAYLETAFTTALALWLGIVVMTGVAAALTFPIVRDLNPTLPTYANYSGEHWRIAAGKVVDKVFLWSNVAQIFCFLGAAASLMVLTLQKQIPFIAAFCRWLFIAILLVILVYHLLMLGPRMNANLTQYWEAAAAGDNPRADVFQSAFNADHPRASRALGMIAITLILSLAVNAWTLTRENGLPRLFVKKSVPTPPPPSTSKSSTTSTAHPPLATKPDLLSKPATDSFPKTSSDSSKPLSSSSNP